LLSSQQGGDNSDEVATGQRGRSERTVSLERPRFKHLTVQRWTNEKRVRLEE